MADGIGNLIGLGVGLGIGLATLNALSNMDPKKKTELESVLNQSRRAGLGFVIDIRDYNQNKVVNILKRAGFVVTDIERIELKKLRIHFRERVR